MEIRTDDARSVTQPANTIAMLNTVTAVIFAIATWTSEDSQFLSYWLACSIFIFFLIPHANDRLARKQQHKYLSLNDTIRLSVQITILVVPWAVITYPALGSGDLRNSLLIISILAGVACSGAMMLFRLPLAAFGYTTVPTIAVCVTIFFEQFYDLWPMIIGTIFYGFMLMIGVLLSWQLARENEENLVRASKANKELQKANKEIQQMADHDSLTGLLNRKAFIEKLENRISQEEAKPFAVFLLDLDRFKNINDGIGHGAGDELLKIIAQRLKNSVTSEDTIARFGGDEFALIVEIGNSPQNATDIADRILSNLNTPATIGPSIIHPNASIGLAFFPNQSQTAEEFIGHADLALHHAKENGRGQHQIYNEGMAAFLIYADKIEHILREALDKDRIEVWYQPKIDLQSGTIVGAEALLRCFDRQGNIIPTEEILNIAEDRGMIPLISETVFKKVKTDILGWYTKNRSVVPIAINVHDYDLKTSNWLLNYLKDMLNNGISRNDIQLEVTEGCFVGRGADAATTALDMIDDLGIKLSLDDFGTGHAALSHLKRLPVSEIKIDQEFIKGINQDTRDEAIAFAAVEIARRMGIVCVAEGIEEEEQLERLKDLRQDGLTIIGQGHYWAPAMPSEEFTAFVDNWQETARRKKSG